MRVNFSFDWVLFTTTFTQTPRPRSSSWNRPATAVILPGLMHLWLALITANRPEAHSLIKLLLAQVTMETILPSRTACCGKYVKTCLLSVNNYLQGEGKGERRRWKCYHTDRARLCSFTRPILGDPLNDLGRNE